MSSNDDDMPNTMLQEREEFYTEIGRALSSWARIENRLLDIFHAALVGAHRGPTSAAYYAVINFRTKLEITTAALTNRLQEHPDTLDTWSKLAGKVLSAAKQRTPLAHNFVMGFPTAKPGERCLLSSSIYDANVWPEGSRKFSALTINDVKVRNQTFDDLAHDLHEFHQTLIALPEPQEEQLAVLPLGALPRSVRTRILRKPPKPPESSQE